MISQTAGSTIPGRIGLRPDQVDSGAIAVVVDGLLDAVAIRVELSADMSQGVPLCRVLEREGTVSSAQTSTYFGFPQLSISLMCTL